ncbi:MAG: type 1 glutamine amidotransferase [Bdellovibrionaceae bacterium]|nr:type 1 glutamine amidotransferase [Pseudobdellovibrionaceae bacterium]
MSTYWLLQHEIETPPGTLTEWLNERGKNVRALYLPDTRGDLPRLEAGDKLLVLGGSMNTDEESLYPWMTAEKALIQDAATRGIAYLGICLGAQLFCEALGGKVRRMPHWEVGWWPVQEHGQSGAVPAFHWHRYECVLPRGAEVLASSKACEVQIYKASPRQLCFQFHPEVDRAWIEASLGPTGTEGLEGFVQSAPEMLHGHELHQPALRDWFFAKLDQWDRS